MCLDEEPCVSSVQIIRGELLETDEQMKGEGVVMK